MILALVMRDHLGVVPKILMPVFGVTGSERTLGAQLLEIVEAEWIAGGKELHCDGRRVELRLSL